MMIGIARGQLVALRCLDYILTYRRGNNRSLEKVSVIIATRNNGATIDKSIATLLHQTYRDLEVIVVDDASTDCTATRLAELAARDSRVHVITNVEHRGTGYSRNLGLKVARGTYVTFQDGDDTSHPSRIAMQVMALQTFRTKIITLCSYMRVDDSGHSILVNNKRMKACVISMMFPREPILHDIGYFINGSLGEDTDYYERIRIKYGHRATLHIWKVLYFALFRPGSSFFSSVNVESERSREINYSRTPEGNEAYQKLNERHDRMRRKELSLFEPFHEN